MLQTGSNWKKIGVLLLSTVWRCLLVIIIKKKETYLSMYKLYGWATLWIEAHCLLNCQRRWTMLEFKSTQLTTFFYYFRSFQKWLKSTVKAQFTKIDIAELLRYRWSLLRNKVCSAMTWNQWQDKNTVCEVRQNL